MSTKDKNILNPNSCWNKAANNEPVFVLRAHDPLAAELVVMWAARYKLAKGDWLRMTVEQRQKFNDALQVAREMQQWQDEDIPF